MKIGIPREIKAQEGRVALLPRHIKTLIEAGHTVYLEKDAGLLSAASNEDYVTAGAILVDTAAELFEQATLIVKVKEILEPEFALLRADHIIFTNIHAALDAEQLDALLTAKCLAISAENTHKFGSPNCPLAGEVGAFEAIRMTMAQNGGTGRHFMSHFGEPAAKAVVIGLGNVGQGSLRTLVPFGIRTVALDIYEGARKSIAMQYHNAPVTVGDVSELEDHIYDADMIINCVLWPKHRKDHLIPRSMLKKLKRGACIVDVSCDTAGAIETSRATSWADPEYTVDGIRHFVVDNIPGSVPVTASAGYGEAILPKILAIADKGAEQAIREDEWLAKGLTCIGGELILEEAGIYQNKPFTPLCDWVKRSV
ncbi:alanine dehydrogenase [Desulfotalea psychrophila]|uniref:Saccharopine dehydrogenase [NAD(+), L-lysine-forming] n=1 Tax=Desulfotalea psychrophila (strain LSv54 / DSM 12343) TaxID=177439 RepID=Q6ANB3_DESPS|nr:NAD(P)-dependent oxidoreductase [Desulfotalea psychrophila]CAG36161.1 related to cold-adapted alanine dehydrogenase [Desulfotalea psychrophila LSv54]